VPVALDTDDIGGVVNGPNGPEAGVWVIAETTDLPTRFARMEVTDNQGPLCGAGFAQGQIQNIGCGGCGLVDFPKVDGEPSTPRPHAQNPAS
jgi:hypothetical protein